MSIELKIKSKHLSEEARIIRFEERKLKRQAQYLQKNQSHDATHEVVKKFYSLHHHRKWDVRNENRATYLARAYISGVPYETVEQKRHDDDMFKVYIFPRVCAMVANYDQSLPYSERRPSKGRYVATDDLKKRIAKWCNL